LNSLFKRKKILITGGTGSLGTALTKKLLETDVDTIRIFSRDELKQSEMRSTFSDDRLRFFIGDVRDKERLARALEEVNIVIHTAALKQVPAVEYNPFEAVKTNVYGAQNLIECCFDKNVDIVLAIGTDKAVSPFNTYGATKLLMERLFVSANFYKGNRDIKFSCVRYGNVLGSRGSFVPIIVNQIQNGKKITITDPAMTRFNITMEQAIRLIFRALKNCKGGEVFIPKLKAYRVGDMKNSVIKLLKTHDNSKRIPIRSGEKFHECLINKQEIRNVLDSKEDYILYDRQAQDVDYPKKDIKKANLNDEYSSDKVDLLTNQQIERILIDEGLVKKLSKS